MASEVLQSEAFDNIVIVNPNKSLNQNGFFEDRNVPQENLVMFVNLECNVTPRSRIVSGVERQGLVQIAASTINFLKPNNSDYLNTDWTEIQSFTSNNVLNSQLLGITSINYRCGASFLPTVDITLEDIRGRALFESGDQSVYSAFFNLPYPTFYLTLKGFYGKAVKYSIILQKFQASFDQSTGNFILTLNFLGYKYNVLTDLTQAYILAVPNMYAQQVNDGVQTTSSTPIDASVDQLNGNDKQTTSTIKNKGYELIKNIYDEYKSKNLIPQDFPNLTVQQLVTKLENFEKTVMTKFGELSINDLSDAREFSNLLEDFKKQIVTATSPSSWKLKYLDDKNFYIIKGNPTTDGKPNNIKIYTYKKQIFEVSENLTIKNALEDLDLRMKSNSENLKNAPTYGQDKGKRQNRIIVDIDSNSVKTQYTVDDIDLNETIKIRYGNLPTTAQTSTFETEIQNLKANIVNENSTRISNGEDINIPYFFQFDGEGFFSDKIAIAGKKLQSKSQSLEEELTKKINDLIATDEGIGFVPSVRNVIAVVIASSEAFLRLMEDVHLKSSIQSRNPIKKKAVPNDIKTLPDSPVYPWPQYAKEVLTEDGTKFELKYPGDPDFIGETGADNYEVWPEVEFVEEFIKGFIQRDQPPLSVNEENNILSTVNRLLISGFDRPSNDSYSVLQDIKFMYEVLERISAITSIQGFDRGGDEIYKSILPFLSNYEATNIITGLGSDDYKLINFYKNGEYQTQEIKDLVQTRFPNISPTSQVFQSYLVFLYLNSKGGTSPLYQNFINGNINTPYLQNNVKNPSSIYITDLPQIYAEMSTDKDPGKIENELIKYLKTPNKNSIEFSDIFPFVFTDWNLNNLNNGDENTTVEKVLDTTKSIYFNAILKKVANYTDSNVTNLKGGVEKNRPILYLSNSNDLIKYDELFPSISQYLSERGSNVNVYGFNELYLQDNFFNTESTINMLNTPIFVKAIQNGVQNFKSGLAGNQNPDYYSSYPYVQAAYLFLNSLPLTDTTYQYRNLIDKTKNNYIGPSFTKFGAIHNLPRMWICRIGSIWHRYKRGITDDIDFLSSCLGSVNFNESFDPLDGNPNRKYTFTSDSTQTSTYDIVLKKETVFTDSNGVTTNQQSLNVGFYPKILNDFYYFLNGENLYNDINNLDGEIQKKIDDGKLVIMSSSNSIISKDAGYDLQNPSNALNYTTKSVLFYNTNGNNKNTSGKYWFSTPSFGSRYSQVSTTCFNGEDLLLPVFDNNFVLNGSLRFYWGSSHYGFCPDIFSLTPNTQTRMVKSEHSFLYLLLNETLENQIYEEISDLFGVFNKTELDLFEKEFLNFSKSSKQSTDNFTLQNILIDCLQVEIGDFNASNDNEKIEKFQKIQQSNYNLKLKNYINQNYIFQKGNPTNFDFKTFCTFTNDPSVWLANVPQINSYDKANEPIPTITNSLTLADSLVNFPNEWKELKLNVGFFNFEGFTYKDEGSYFTDFFPTLNVGFTVENIVKYAQIIKIFATRKALYTNPQGYTADIFKSEMTNYINRLTYFKDNLFNDIMTKLQKNLPTFSKNNQPVEQSAMTGMQSKLQYYEIFKAINDKWVSGTDFVNDSLFDDILFVDRANRDIGGEVIVDIFEVTKNLKSNPQASVYNIIASIIEKNNFVIFSMPAYINFYNVQNVGDPPQEDSLNDFGSKLFGIFPEVDYQGAKQKLICQYVDTPSEHLDNRDIQNGFNDDSFNFGSPVNNPLIENSENKKNKNDYGISNKVVGFWADFGIQNQGVFRNISVSQDSGKPTAESLQAEYDLANTYTGTKSYTQNVSLYNIYKTRSYSSEVEMMGNAMIQPTMYFVLRHVPLFSGPYLITDVEHNITTGGFLTKAKGTRQKLYTPPIKNPLINSIKQNFITKLVNEQVTKKQIDKRTDANTIKVRDQISNEINSEYSPSPSPICKVMFDGYVVTAVTPSTISVIDLQTSIRDSYIQYSAETFSYITYTLYYLGSYGNNGFNYYNNNPALIPLGETYPKWGGDLTEYFNKNYICLNNTKNISDAFASFTAITTSNKFIYDRFKSVFNETMKYIDDENNFVETFARTWIEMFPYDKTKQTADLYTTFKSTNPTDYQNLISKIRKAYLDIKSFFGT
jgi:hypothetical protein